MSHKGKVAALRLLQKNTEFVEAFKHFGTTEETPDHILDKLEQFRCHLYGSSKLTKINNLKHVKFQEQFSATSLSGLMDAYTGMDMSLMPCCRDALIMQLKRANFQTLVWFSAAQTFSDLPGPDGHGWESKDGTLQITWTNILQARRVG